MYLTARPTPIAAARSIGVVGSGIDKTAPTAAPFTAPLDNCAVADAYATAFMAMGLEKSKIFLEKNPKLQAILLFSDADGNINEYTNYSNN